MMLSYTYMTNSTTGYVLIGTLPNKVTHLGNKNRLNELLLLGFNFCMQVFRKYKFLNNYNSDLLIDCLIDGLNG